MAGKLYFAAPDGHRWPLAVNTLTTRLQQRFPLAKVAVRTSVITGSTVLDFDLPFSDGEWRHGTYVDGGKLALSDGTAEQWADILAWILALMTATEPVMVMIEEGSDIVPLPEQDRTPDRLAAFLASVQ